MHVLVNLLIGMVMGAALHRARFCVAAGFRDLLLFRDAGPARGVLAAVALATPFFALVQARAAAAGAPVPGRFGPLGVALLAGAVLFGIGIVPAGGCACSAILRSGEGHLRFLWVLLGLMAGGLLGAMHWGWWQRLTPVAPVVHLPTALGWWPALLLQGALLAALFAGLRRLEGNGRGR